MTSVKCIYWKSQPEQSARRKNDSQIGKEGVKLSLLYKKLRWPGHLMQCPKRNKQFMICKFDNYIKICSNSSDMLRKKIKSKEVSVIFIKEKCDNILCWQELRKMILSYIVGRHTNYYSPYASVKLKHECTIDSKFSLPWQFFP